MCHAGFPMRQRENNSGAIPKQLPVVCERAVPVCARVRDDAIINARVVVGLLVVM